MQRQAALIAKQGSVSETMRAASDCRRHRQRHGGKLPGCSRQARTQLRRMQSLRCYHIFRQRVTSGHRKSTDPAHCGRVSQCPAPR